MPEALTKAQERGAEARDPTSDAAYFASIWQLSNYQLKQLEDAFRASQASAVKAAGLTTQPLVPDEGAIDTADVASAASADIAEAYYAAADARLASLRAAPRSKPEPGIKAIAYEIALFLGVPPWAVNNGGVEAWERYRPLAERIRALQESHDAE